MVLDGYNSSTGEAETGCLASRVRIYTHTQSTKEHTERDSGQPARGKQALPSWLGYIPKARHHGPFPYLVTSSS